MSEAGVGNWQTGGQGRGVQVPPQEAGQSWGGLVFHILIHKGFALQVVTPVRSQGCTRQHGGWEQWVGTTCQSPAAS